MECSHGEAVSFALSLSLVVGTQVEAGRAVQVLEKRKPSLRKGRRRGCGNHIFNVELYCQQMVLTGGSFASCRPGALGNVWRCFLVVTGCGGKDDAPDI